MFTNLETNLLSKIKVNTPAVRQRLATMFTRRAIKQGSQIAYYIKAIESIDLTTLQADDTETNVRRLCEKAINPVNPKFLNQLGFDKKIKVGAVCVYERMIPYAKEVLINSEIPIAAVSTDFPAGQTSLDNRLSQIEHAVKLGANEIDVVINRELLLTNQYKKLFDEIKEMKKSCGNTHMKVILGTGQLGTLETVWRGSEVAMQAGADFIKTSTGFEQINATFSVGLTMIRAIRNFYERTGKKIGFKPAGGIKTAADSLKWLTLIKEELGDEWLNPKLFRIGASTLLADIERQLQHFATGGYGSNRYNPIS
ncbi:MAG: deoxyribose-phosphate aldolase [Bacteroidetes bacterium]|nr:deoxyribose-phosphate aldolase [Bacteroidota bacterium]